MDGCTRYFSRVSFDRSGAWHLLKHTCTHTYTRAREGCGKRIGACRQKQGLQGGQESLRITSAPLRRPLQHGSGPGAASGQSRRGPRVRRPRGPPARGPAAAGALGKGSGAPWDPESGGLSHGARATAIWVQAAWGVPGWNCPCTHTCRPRRLPHPAYNEECRYRCRGYRPRDPKRDPI